VSGNLAGIDATRLYGAATPNGSTLLNQNSLSSAYETRTTLGYACDYPIVIASGSVECCGLDCRRCEVASIDLVLADQWKWDDV
jgi:hypothetical protein